MRVSVGAKVIYVYRVRVRVRVRVRASVSGIALLPRASTQHHTLVSPLPRAGGPGEW